jgi:hypothetical protein
LGKTGSSQLRYRKSVTLRTAAAEAAAVLKVGSQYAAATSTVTLTAPAEPYRRADLVFHGVDHGGASYEGRLFVNHPDAGLETPTDDSSYVEHQLTPMTKWVIVTDRLRALVEPGADFTVRILPYVRPEHAGPLPDSLVAGLLKCERVDVLT